MLTLEQLQSGIVAIRASGKLTREDYESFVPQFETLAQQKGPLRLLVELEDFRGWDLPALWDELKFDIDHREDLSRTAIVGERKWHEWGTRLSKPLFEAEIRYFDRDRTADALAWLNEADCHGRRGAMAERVE